MPVNSRSVETLLTAGMPDDNFGWTVTTVGNKVYVGAWNEQKVYEYEKTGGNYSLISEITPNGPSEDFGNQVVVKGNWMAVGAPAYFNTGAGQVFLFKKQGGSWVQHDILTGPAEGRNFGSALAMEANKLAVASDGTTYPITTEIIVFEQNGNTWTETAALTEFGYWFVELDMSEDGKTIAGPGSLNNSLFGARLLTWTEEGSNWVFEDSPLEVPGFFAINRDVAIDDQTIVLTIIIPGNRHFVYSLGEGGWEVTAELTTPPHPSSNRFVEIQDGTIVIGLDAFDNAISEKVCVFEGAGSSWQLTNTLLPSDGGVDARLWSVAIDGNTIVAGLPGIPLPPDYEGPAEPGKVYIWD